MTAWKFIDTSRLVVFRVLDDGQVESRLAAALDQKKDFPVDDPDPAAPQALQEAVVDAVQLRLDDFARTRAYDGILSACSYAASTVPQFKAEGDYCVQARDAHWSTCYQLLAEVQAGLRAVPTLDEVLAALPALQWPL